jgi:HAD superfamily hydrolase (TIGR01509 family)
VSAILFGSISTLADTSELQRRAFNEAFAAHGLDWQWSRDDYVAMLGSNGGAQRVADYAASRGADVDASAVHATKSAIFQELLATEGATPRPGVVATVQRAKQEGHRLGLVTTTSADNVTALLAALASDLDGDAFDLVVDSSSVREAKPDPASYRFALDELGESSGSAVAIEDNVGGVHAAVGAGIACIAFPNQNTAGADFGAAVETVDELDADRVLARAQA